MSLKASVRALPTMLRIGFAEAVAYRAEMIIWILSSTMPLVMLALWHEVAREAPIGRFGEPQITGYFLCTFIVRNLASSWVVWLINMEIREGTLALRMLRPIHPLLAYAVGSLSELPVRGLLSIPLAALALYFFAGEQITRDPFLWALWALSIVGAWLITILVNLIMGCAALFMESSLKLADVWLGLYFVLSGYLIPVELFPAYLRGALDWLPFRYQLALPVELMTGAHDHATAVALLARQWVYIAFFFGAVHFAWRRGLRRFAAYGG